MRNCPRNFCNIKPLPVLPVSIKPLPGTSALNTNCFHQRFIIKMSRSYWLPSMFMFPNFLCCEPSSALFMLPKFISHRVPEVIIHRMRRAPNDATPDCVCKVLSFYDHSSPRVTACGHETERRHISGLTDILIKGCLYDYSSIFTTFAYIHIGHTFVFRLLIEQICLYVRDLFKEMWRNVTFRIIRINS